MFIRLPHISNGAVRIASIGPGLGAAAAGDANVKLIASAASAL